MIHERIRRARVLKGLSLEAVAQRLGDISKQALSKFESGAAAPNSARILQLAQALGVKPEYFFRPEGVKLEALEFRKLASMPKYRQGQVEEQMRDHLERYAALEHCFEAAQIGPAAQTPHQFAVASVEDAEAAAKKLRTHWQIGIDAIAHLTELLEEHGIKVALLDGTVDFDGACATTQDQQHVLIALNRTRAGERMRFTAAHELGHWVMALPADMPAALQESCCHRFAGAFLYPAQRVLLEFGSHQRHRVFAKELLNAKQRYGMSMQAVLRRLKDLKLLSEGGYKSMHIQFSQNGWRSREPEELLPEAPRRFESLVYRGLAEDLFTPSRAAEFLQCAVTELDPTLRASFPEPA